MPPGITALQLPGAVGGSCKGRHKLAGPYAAYFAALVPLRVYPSESVPYKDHRPFQAVGGQESPEAAGPKTKRQPIPRAGKGGTTAELLLLV